jgi:hypothetical protein
MWNSRKTQCGAKQFLAGSVVRAASFALLKKRAIFNGVIGDAFVFMEFRSAPRWFPSKRLISESSSAGSTLWLSGAGDGC